MSYKYNVKELKSLLNNLPADTQEICLVCGGTDKKLFGDERLYKQINELSYDICYCDKDD